MVLRSAADTCPCNPLSQNHHRRQQRGGAAGRRDFLVQRSVDFWLQLPRVHEHHQRRVGGRPLHAGCVEGHDLAWLISRGEAPPRRGTTRHPLSYGGVGCSVAACSGNRGTIVVCRYSQAGNVLGQFVANVLPFRDAVVGEGGAAGGRCPHLQRAWRRPQRLLLGFQEPGVLLLHAAGRQRGPVRKARHCSQPGVLSILGQQHRRCHLHRLFEAAA